MLQYGSSQKTFLEFKLPMYVRNKDKTVFTITAIKAVTVYH